MQHYNKTTPLFLAILFPFAGLIYSLVNWRQPSAKNAFWVACIYLGAVLIFLPEGTAVGVGRDGARYAMWLSAMYNSGVTLQSLLSGYLVEEQTMDLYQPLLTFWLSRFTDNAHVLFTVFAVVFGYFYSRNIWYILDRLPHKKLGYIAILVALFFLACPITQINGVRMWTALHVFVYAMMPYLVERDKSKLWWLAVAPLIHFSFLYVSIMAAGYVLIPYRMKAQGKVFLTVALVVFIVSLFINSVNLSSVNAVLTEYSPESFEERIDSYVDEDLAERMIEATLATNWYVGASGIIKNWSYGLLLVLLLPCLRRNYYGGSAIYNMYAFALLFGAFANIMALIPSGGRFLLVAQMFSLSLILLVSVSIPKKDPYRQYLNIALAVLIIPLIVDVRKLLDFYGINAIFGNFITVFFWEDNVPLIDWIKLII